MAGITDGMGGEEVNQAQEQTSQIYITGSVTTGGQISGLNVYAQTTVQADNITGDTKISGANIYSTGAVTGIGWLRGRITNRARNTLSGTGEIFRTDICSAS